MAVFRKGEICFGEEWGLAPTVFGVSGSGWLRMARLADHSRIAFDLVDELEPARSVERVMDLLSAALRSPLNGPRRKSICSACRALPNCRERRRFRNWTNAGRGQRALCMDLVVPCSLRPIIVRQRMEWPLDGSQQPERADMRSTS